MSSYGLSADFDPTFSLFDPDKERLERIKKLERLRERRYTDSKSVKKIGVKGDFSYLDEYGKRLERDMEVFKDITRKREKQERTYTERPISPLPPLFDISPLNSPQMPKHSYRFIGDENYTSTRMAMFNEMGANGAMQQIYGDENNPYCISGPEGAAIAAERLNQINERLASLKLKTIQLQDGIKSREEEEERLSSNKNGYSTSPNSEKEDVNPNGVPEIKVTCEDTTDSQE